MDLELKGKTALVTGASKGIGLGVAESLATEGAHLHLAARTEAALAEAKRRLEAQHGISVKIHPVDLSQSSAAKELAAVCADVDILVNNAGAIPGGDIEAINEEIWREAWELKVFGYVNLTREFLRRMKARGSGVILNVIGVAGERPDAGYIAGSAGNASLIAFTRALGSRSMDDGVRVLAVNPGSTGTDRIVQLFKTRAQAQYGDESRWEEYLQKQPAGRTATVREVADTVAYLVSPRASYISGTVVTVDGGLAGRAG
ncbi:MAG TPA: SDR family oxidoreductase [bacterium]|nr:SDR family oxidoreductase [bacterium]